MTKSPFRAVKLFWFIYAVKYKSFSTFNIGIKKHITKLTLLYNQVHDSARGEVYSVFSTNLADYDFPGDINNCELTKSMCGLELYCVTFEGRSLYVAKEKRAYDFFTKLKSAYYDGICSGIVELSEDD